MTERLSGEKNLEALGQMLKTRREVKGMTRRDVVMKIKIPLEQLESIEEGRVSSLPPVFAKGFLRAYANDLGLDAEEILDDYRRMTGGFKNEPASREPLAPRYVETSVDGGVMPGVKFVGVIVLIVLALGAAFWFSAGFRATVVSLAPVLKKAPHAGDPGEALPAEPEGLTGESGENSDGEPAAADETERSAATTVLPEIDLAEPAAAAPGGALVLSAQKDGVWAQIVVDDQPPEFCYFSAGQEISWQAERSITVTTGDFSALVFNWNGRVFNSMSRSIVEVTLPEV
ncbi:MAG: helix-turn-helix domain-containing protein [Candidatus Adiutrix sp.]|nr:helix-turn-helix domain-containing protein [Candidatus Adiutrix sp.]